MHGGDLECAELAHAQADAAARERHLPTARTLFQEMSAPARVAEIDALLSGSWPRPSEGSRQRGGAYQIGDV